MACGCGDRAVKLLELMHYVRVYRVDDDWVECDHGDFLVKGDEVVAVEDAEEHHAKVSITAVAKEAAAFVKRLGGAR